MPNRTAGEAAEAATIIATFTALAFFAGDVYAWIHGAEQIAVPHAAALIGKLNRGITLRVRT